MVRFRHRGAGLRRLAGAGVMLALAATPLAPAGTAMARAAPAASTTARSAPVPHFPTPASALPQGGAKAGSATTPGASSAGATTTPATGATTTTPTTTYVLPRTPGAAGGVTPGAGSSLGGRLLARPTEAHRAARAGGSSLSTGALVAALLAALLIAVCAVWGVLRWYACEPHWTLSARHACSEAGLRLSARIGR
jgi:hypothetical protein